MNIADIIDEAKKRSIMPWWEDASAEEIAMAKKLAQDCLGGSYDIEMLVYKDGSGNQVESGDGPVMPLRFDQYWGVRPYWATFLRIAKLYSKT